jgi:ribosomal-protein-alanine N-acetyltransferase
MELFIIQDTKYSRECCFFVHNGEKSVLSDWIGQFSAEELRKQGWTRDLLLQSCLQNKQLCVVQNDKILGLIHYHQPAVGVVEVLFLATSPQLQNQGIMAQLLDQFLQANRGSEIWLECRADNLRARHLYLKKGFRETGRRPRYYSDGSAAILFNF